MPQRWQGTITMQGVESCDHRILETVIWRDLPRSLRVQTEDFGGHDGAQPCGAIETLEVRGDGRVWATGTWSESESGQLAAQWVDEGVLRAVSVDGGTVGPDPVVEWVDPVTGEVVPLERIYEVMDRMEAAQIAGDTEEEARLAEWLDSLYARERYPVFEIMAATLVATEAFPDASIENIPDDAPAVVPVLATTATSNLERFATLRWENAAGDVTTFTAAAPARFRADWFQPQTYIRPTKWTIGDDGRISGHLFTWGSCHRSWTGVCVTPERQADFGDYHCGEVCLDNGERLRTGVMTFADLHAGDGHGLTVAQLNRLMEDTGTQLGPVRLHADEFGVQACGQVYDDVDPTACARALAGYPSGDWRKVAGAWRLFGLHVVNTPGYPMYEEVDGEPVRMVASMAPVTGPLTEAALEARPVTVLEVGQPLVIHNGSVPQFSHMASAPCGCAEPDACACDLHVPPTLSPLAAAALNWYDVTTLGIEGEPEPPSAAERLAALIAAD